jgi:hypothetical protein
MNYGRTVIIFDKTSENCDEPIYGKCKYAEFFTHIAKYPL